MQIENKVFRPWSSEQPSVKELKPFIPLQIIVHDFTLRWLETENLQGPSFNVLSRVHTTVQ